MLVCSHIAHLSSHRIELYTGNYSAFEQIRSERLSLQQHSYAKQQREIAHMQEFVQRFRAKATKARQAQSRLKALERMEVIAQAHVDSPFFVRNHRYAENISSLTDAEKRHTGLRNALVKRS